MSDNMKIALTGFWLMLSSACVVLPVFIPSNVYSSDPLGNVVGTSAVTIFVLSFPASLLGLPISMLIQSAMDVGQYSLMGLWINTLVFFALGVCQWFWAVPRLRTFTAQAQAAGVDTDLTMPARELSRSAQFTVCDDDELSPVERVIERE